MLDFSFKSFVELFKEKNAAVVMCDYIEDVHTLSRSGVMIPDENFKVLSMEEKPENPKSNWCVGPFYIYKKEDLHRIQEAIDDGCKTDAPGSLVSYLCEKIDIYALKIEGNRYDIGTLESYEAVKKVFGN